MQSSGQLIERVIRCWSLFASGKSVIQLVGGNPEVEQHADCYVDGLHATPFHNISSNPKLAWALNLQKNTKVIGDEVIIDMTSPSSLKHK